MTDHYGITTNTQQSTQRMSEIPGPSLVRGLDHMLEPLSLSGEGPNSVLRNENRFTTEEANTLSVLGSERGSVNSLTRIVVNKNMFRDIYCIRNPLETP